MKSKMKSKIRKKIFKQIENEKNYFQVSHILKNTNIRRNFFLQQYLFNKFKTPAALCWFACDLFHKRVPLYEPVISQDIGHLKEYANRVIKGKLPEELHNIMMCAVLSNNPEDKRKAELYFQQQKFWSDDKNN